MTKTTVDIKKLVEDYKAMRAQFMKDGQELIKKAFTEFFNQNPKVGAISWTQYAPYFNDGEPCVFRVWGFYAIPAVEADNYEEFGKYPDSYGHDKWTGEEYTSKYYTPTEWLKIEDFFDIMEGVPEDIFEDMFGDSFRVTATAKGFEVKEYDHD